MQNIPAHIGLILDGNRRWARANGLPTIEGHRQGYKTLKDIRKVATDMGVQYISAYVFSTENWGREEEEVKGIMSILSWAVKYEVKEMHAEGIRLRVIGSKDKLGAGMLKSIAKAEELTANNTRGTLVLCLDYSGRQETVDAVKQLSSQGVVADDMTIDMITANLYAPDIPAPDLIIRTSGEQRLSNFLMWQSSYSELMFVPKNWPDFDETDFRKAIEDYGNLQRRYGK